MRRTVSDTDTIRRQNRGLVLDAIRRLGPLSRTHLAQETGLSHASITAIAGDMIARTILLELPDDTSDLKARGRPAIRVGFNRDAGYTILLEIDVNKTRCSLIDYSSTLVDRIDVPMSPETFTATSPIDFVMDQIEQIRQRNPETKGKIYCAAASVQGILDRDNDGLHWSPVAGLAGHNLASELTERCGFPLKIYKRGRMLAEGTRWLYPDLYNANFATVFIGSTVAMGMSFHGQNVGRSEDAATEFGHMIHIPNGALCRCGTRGCIEAYASDYGVLRSAYGVPDRTAPAPAVPPSEYAQIVARAQRHDRDAIHAFNLAGSAIGFGLNRLMTVFDPSHIIIVGLGATALPFMRQELETALSASLIARVHGVPEIITHNDENEPVFKGLMMKALGDLDQNDFAALPSVTARAETK